MYLPTRTVSRALYTTTLSRPATPDKISLSLYISQRVASVSATRKPKGRSNSPSWWSVSNCLLSASLLSTSSILGIVSNRSSFGLTPLIYKCTSDPGSHPNPLRLGLTSSLHGCTMSTVFLPALPIANHPVVPKNVPPSLLRK